MTRATTVPAYDTDLAYVHDAGFGEFARAAAGELLALLRHSGRRGGLVIELGCGSGILSERVAAAGYDVLGFDISPAMVALARQRVPRGKFRAESFLNAELPPCVAVAAVGEIFNYLFDGRNAAGRLRATFRRVARALEPGGVFLFDVAAPGRAGGSRVRNYNEGPDWACLYTASEDAKRRTLTRDIVTFRRTGELYRRSQEIHRLKLYERRDVIAQLRAAGFKARTLRGYGEQKLPRAWHAFAARKA